MKKTLLQMVAVGALSLVVGSGYILATGKLEFWVAADRYPDARVCRRGTESEPSPPPAGPVTDGGAPRGAPGVPTESKAPAVPAPDRIPHILFDEAVELWREGLLFVDARTMKRYVEGHIPGAVPIGAWEPGLEEKIERLAESEPVAAPVIVYCTRSKDCEDSHIVGNRLREFGFLDVQIFDGGYPEWLDRNMPVQVGEEPGPRGEDPGEGSQQ